MLILVVGFLVQYSEKPLRPPVIISHYKFTLCQVAPSMELPSIDSEKINNEYPKNQIWIKVEIEQADDWRNMSGQRLMLDGGYIIPTATLTTAEGKSLKMFEAQPESVDPLQFRIVHFVYDKFNPDGDRQKYYMIYGFDNAIGAKRADFEAVVHMSPYDLNALQTPDPSPINRPLRFDNLSLP